MATARRARVHEPRRDLVKEEIVQEGCDGRVVLMD
jgi:hypothetical protein